jgi:hypothetical protein
MPRHIARALDQLFALPVRTEEHVRSAAFSPLEEYVYSLRNYHALGIPIAAEHLDRFAALWKTRVDLRPVLSGFVLHHPCDAFHRAFRREYASTLRGDIAAWLRAYPELRDELLPHVKERAGLFNQADIAVDAALAWARYFDGGEEAIRAAANALNRHDRQHKKRVERVPYAFDGLRHDLEDHGRLYRDEVEALNRHLVPLGAEPLQYGGMNMWWQAPPIDWDRHPSRHGPLLSWAAAASHDFAGPAWSEADEADYAARLAALPPEARRGFWIATPRDDREIPALRRIRDRAEALAAGG